MREYGREKEGVSALVRALVAAVEILEGRTVAKDWIRRSAFEKRITELRRRAGRVKAKNAWICRWLRPELRAVSAAMRKLERVATEARRSEANERYAQRRLQNADADPVLKGLHPAQRRAVVVAEDTQLVLAGAGTGKTQTMAAKVADRLRNGRTTPGGIAVITFTNKAADELRERIAQLAGQTTEDTVVGTIHKLAKRVLEGTPGGGRTRIDPIAELKPQRYRALERMLDEALKAHRNLRESLRVRAQAYVRIPPNDGRLDGETVRVSLRNDKSMDVRSHGEAAICRALDERGIPFIYEAPFVEEHPTEEEKEHKPEVAKVKEECLRRGYRPDFMIALDEGIIVWLEHWAVDRKGNPPGGRKTEERRKYVEEMKWKRRTHQVMETLLAETDYGQYADALEEEKDWDTVVVEALSRAADRTPGWLDERFPRRDDGWRPEAETIRILVQEIDEWIGAAGRSGLKEAEIERRIARMDAGNSLAEAQALATLAKAVRARYEAHLEQARTTDFEKLILDAAKALETEKAAPGLDAVIVDEWQDVNGAQERFVRALSRHGGKAGARPTLCVVGDDWQSIYGFQGGDPAYTRDFAEKGAEKGDACERTDLTRTWRFGKRCADATRRWALADGNAVDKRVEGDESKDGIGAVIEIVGRTVTKAGAARLGGTEGLESAETAIGGILEKIREKGSETGANVLLLARRRNTVADRNRPEDEEVRKVLEEWRTRPWQIPNEVDKHDETEVRNAAVQRARKRKAEGLNHGALRNAAMRAGLALDLETLTVHGAKGLEADYVIFVQGKDRKIKDEAREKALARALEPLLPAGANGPEEERRIWYVALTRAKKGTYVVAPPGDAEDTALLDELQRDERRQYGVGTAELADWLEAYQEGVACPKCAAMGQTGRLVARTARMGREFVGCTSFRYTDVVGARSCGHMEWRCPVCRRGVVRRTNDRRGQCTERECGEKIPLCGCAIPKPMTIRRNRRTGEAFWGCQDYRGSENPTCGRMEPLAREPAGGPPA